MKYASTPLLVAFGLAAGISAAGAANTAPPQETNVPSYAKPVVADANAMRGADEIHHANLRQQLQTDLAKAGYTDVTITPSSFYIHAKDKAGNPVAMVIGPDSLVEVTETAMKAPKAASSAPQATPSPQTQSTQKP